LQKVSKSREHYSLLISFLIFFIISLTNSVSSVSPENAVEIESTYKPSAGTIGRAFIKAIDFFKERIFRLNNKVRDADMWKYDWQHATVGQDWRPLTKMHESGFRAEKIADKVKRFLARDSAKVRVGDRYELRLTAVDRNHSGYYRCVNKHGRRVVSMITFDIPRNSVTNSSCSSVIIHTHYVSGPPYLQLFGV
uniref:Ig-like domain-containing protein n=1 Tax=Angiostrongylus cantonensis TaxID=6313 RepID=A0A0K0DR53_ANGCA